jgi:hypothetical protein
VKLLLLKKYKSPGNDQILAEVIQAGGEALQSEIHELVTSLWNKEELLDQWKECITSPYADEIIGDHQCTAVTNKYLIPQEFKSRLYSGNTCYHPVKNLLSFHLLSKNVKIKMYKTVIFTVVFYVCNLGF